MHPITAHQIATLRMAELHRKADQYRNTHVREPRQRRRFTWRRSARTVRAHEPAPVA